jgi:hypothetical protein
MPLAPFCCFGGSGCGLIMTREPGPNLLSPAANLACSCRTLGRILGGSGYGLIEISAPRPGWAAIEGIAVALSVIAKRPVANKPVVKKRDLRNMFISCR